jgi:hypothetical protein
MLQKYFYKISETIQFIIEKIEIKHKYRDQILHDLIKSDFGTGDFDDIQTHFSSHKSYKKEILKLKREKPLKVDNRYLWDYFLKIFQDDNIELFQKIESLAHFLKPSFFNKTEFKSYIKYPFRLMFEADCVHIFDFFISQPQIQTNLSLLSNDLDSYLTEIIRQIIQIDCPKIFQYCLENNTFLLQNYFENNQHYLNIFNHHNSIKIADFLWNQKQYPLPKKFLSNPIQNDVLFLYQKLLLSQELKRQKTQNPLKKI